MSVLDLAATYLALNGTGGASELPGAHFGERLSGAPEDMAYLVGVYPQTQDWDHWEMHPEGHEVLVMLDARLEVTFDQDGVFSTHLVEPGSTLIVPPGAWHRARVLQPGRMLGITYGAGTQHRPLAAS